MIRAAPLLDLRAVLCIKLMLALKVIITGWWGCVSCVVLSCVVSDAFFATTLFQRRASAAVRLRSFLRAMTCRCNFEKSATHVLHPTHEYAIVPFPISFFPHESHFNHFRIQRLSRVRPMRDEHSNGARLFPSPALNLQHPTDKTPSMPLS